MQHESASRTEPGRSKPNDKLPLIAGNARRDPSPVNPLAGPIPRQLPDSKTIIFFLKFAGYFSRFATLVLSWVNLLQTEGRAVPRSAGGDYGRPRTALPFLSCLPVFELPFLFGPGHPFFQRCSSAPDPPEKSFSVNRTRNSARNQKNGAKVSKFSRNPFAV